MPRKTYLLLVTYLSIIYSCGDPCDEGYTQQTNFDGSTYCVPDFILGYINNFELGDTYYHDEYGIIRIQNEMWFDSSNQRIFPKTIRTN